MLRMLFGVKSAKMTGKELADRYRRGLVLYAIKNDAGKIVGSEWAGTTTTDSRYDYVIGGATEFWRISDKKNWFPTSEHDNDDLYEVVYK